MSSGERARKPDREDGVGGPQVLWGLVGFGQGLGLGLGLGLWLWLRWGETAGF